MCSTVERAACAQIQDLEGNSNAHPPCACLQADEFSRVMEPLFKQIARCLTSSHFQVAERSLFLWNNEYIVQQVAQRGVGASDQEASLDHAATLVCPIVAERRSCRWSWGRWSTTPSTTGTQRCTALRSTCARCSQS